MGDAFVVLSMLVDPKAVWPILLQALHPDRGPIWWAAEMFETIDSTLPSNWVMQLWSDATLHIAPEPWLRPGFWLDYTERRNREAVETFERELAVILRES